jgi:anti-sigma factor RsiW
MELQEQLKLQAYLDGELPQKEVRVLAEKLARDADAAALLVELRQTRDALAGFEEEIRLPESREFFWSKIEREIERAEKPAPMPTVIPWAARLRRFLVPATAMALLAIAGLVTVRQEGSSGGEIETSLADPGAFTYRDYNSGTTLVWLSYPAENELGDEQAANTVE